METQMRLQIRYICERVCDRAHLRSSAGVLCFAPKNTNNPNDNKLRVCVHVNMCVCSSVNDEHWMWPRASRPSRDPPPPRRRWPSVSYVDWGSTGRGAMAGPQDPAPTHLGPRTMFEHLPTALRSEGRACYSLQSIPVGQCGLDWASLLSNKPYACKLCPIASAGASVIRTNGEPQLLTEWILSACSKWAICLSIWMCEDETSQSDSSIWCYVCLQGPKLTLTNWHGILELQCYIV